MVNLVEIKDIKADSSWAFDNLSRKQTNYVSHGYHKYPAKFIPQLVDKLITNYSREGDTILDCFGGCGTTLVESKLKQRNSIILDVNDAALLITAAKKTAINPIILGNYNQILLNNLSKIKIKKDYYISAHPRLKYWFKKDQYNKLMEIFLLINRIDNRNIRIFYQCCFSNILKNCSIWFSKSIKPMRDYNKPDYDPVESFTKHLKFMTLRNEEYYNHLKKIEKVSALIQKRDARKTGLKSESIDLIITSPPYAISYEYADLHQLTLLWFGFAKDMNNIKKEFIGTSSTSKETFFTNSEIANRIVKHLYKKDKSLSRQIGKYYSDMFFVFKEMHRVLRKNGGVCIIIGDTQYKKIKVRNVEVFIDLLNNIGFKTEKIIKRKLSSKTFTPYRDNEGKFTNACNGEKKRVYQYEYILIAKKP